jgi:murein DD-endopeptidase MepM/ murein hydrolase activator NlpD
MANFSKNRPVFKSKAEMYKKSNWVKFQEYISLLISNLNRWFAKIAYRVNEKGSQRLTIMVVPHSEKKIVNLQISNYILFFTTVILSVTIATSIIAISNNQQTTKQLDRLKTQDGYKKIMIEEYRKSIDSVNKRFTMFKSDINNIIKSAGKDKNIYNFNDIEILDEYSNRNVPKEVSDLEKLKLELDVTKENIRRMGVFIAEQKNLLKSMPSIYPLAMRARVSSVYGNRVDPIYKWKSEFHSGLDMCTLPGIPIFAAADGDISIAGFTGGYGFLVEIKHKYGFFTRYGHMMRFAPGIYVGSTVKQGQTIGYVGTSGKSTGYHLHYEVRIGDRVVDPEPFVSMLP